MLRPFTKAKRAAVTLEDAKNAIIRTLARAKLGSIESGLLKHLVADELSCRLKTVDRAYSELVKEGRIQKAQIRQKDGTNKWYASLTSSI